MRYSEKQLVQCLIYAGRGFNEDPMSIIPSLTSALPWPEICFMASSSGLLWSVDHVEVLTTAFREKNSSDTSHLSRSNLIQQMSCFKYCIMFSNQSYFNISWWSIHIIICLGNWTQRVKSFAQDWIVHNFCILKINCVYLCMHKTPDSLKLEL